MRAACLGEGGVVGICSPSHIADYWEYQELIKELQNRGFRVKEGDNLYKSTHLYEATPEERAADFNQLVADPEVGLVLFGGGEAGNELLPYIDFENIKRNPKRFCSYSDGTFILNPIYALTGLETYYGQSPQMLRDMNWYDEKMFYEHLVYGNAEFHMPNSEWIVTNPGVGEGILIGGYARNFAMMLGSKYCQFDMNEKYVLFIEDHEVFGGVDYVSAMVEHILQDKIMDRVTGIVFGNYSDNEHPELLWRLERIGKQFNIPVVYCDDFGHGSNHAIMPIGRRVKLDTEKKLLRYL